MIPRRRIIVFPSREFERRRAFFDLLAAAFPVEFVTSAAPEAAAAGLIAWIDSDAVLQRISARRGRILVVNDHTPPRVPVVRGHVAFPATAPIDRAFRGHALREHSFTEFAALKLADRDELVCSLDAVPCWSVRRVDGVQLTRVSFDPPEVGATDTFYQHFNRLRWLRFLPFVDFVQHVVGEEWSPPPLRACLMFDDPNLHRRTYGFLDFARLARHGLDCHYHAAIATIPADAWFFHAAAARVFRTHAAQLSLLIHGNDHTAAELGRDRGGDAFTRLFAQALRRIERFELRSGLPVARVMAPPVGAFCAGAATHLLRLGFEALCVSRSSLCGWNPALGWPRAFGHDPVEFLGDGLPVIPRHVLAPDQDENYRLAAFLRQPIIPHGHHRDCADHLDLLSRVADTINNLGPVAWCDMTTLSRSNYQTRREEGTLVVRLLARRATLPPVDSGIRRIRVVRPWLAASGSPGEPLACRQAGHVLLAAPEPGESREIPVAPGSPLELDSPPPAPLDPHRVPPPPRRVWPLVRRALAETRDRLAPLLPHAPARPR